MPSILVGLAFTEAEAKRLAERGVAGALAGATMGAVAGGPGAIAGAVVGAIAGAVAGRAVETGEEARRAEDRELDHETGVSEGNLGALDLEHPPAKIGAYSGGSLGVGAVEGDDDVAEGPFELPPK
jgi:hypothetical protein